MRRYHYDPLCRNDNGAPVVVVSNNEWGHRRVGGWVDTANNNWGHKSWGGWRDTAYSVTAVKDGFLSSRR